MTDRLDERLGSTLEQRAGSIGAPLSYSAEDIVRMGRRATRRRALGAWATAAAGVTAVVLIGVPIMLSAGPDRTGPSTTESSKGSTSAVPTSCTVERLAVPPGGTKSLVMAMDPTGRHIVGRTAHPGSTSRFDLLLWDDGALRRVDLPGERQIPTDVNAGGVVVGTVDVGAQAWMYRDGSVTLLPGTGSAAAAAISDDGIVVGTNAGRPVVWRSASGVPTTLPLPEGAGEGRATDISADGRTILGDLHRPQSSHGRGYVWSSGEAPRELPLPVVDGTAALGTSAVAIAGDWVTGSAELATGSVPVRWNLRTGEVQTFPAVHIPGLQISADGWLPATDGRGHAILLLNQQATLSLPGLPERGDFSDVAKAISQNGLLIAGDASSAGAAGTLPALWRCT